MTGDLEPDQRFVDYTHNGELIQIIWERVSIADLGEVIAIKAGGVYFEAADLSPLFRKQLWSHCVDCDRRAA